MERDAAGRAFASEDDEARHYLTLLRDGGHDQKRAARDQLGRIFERRGLVDEAAACYETNLAEGVSDPSLYARLADVYRRQGRPDRADELLATTESPSEPRQSAPSRPPVRASDGVPPTISRRAGQASVMAGAHLPLRAGLGVAGCVVILATLALLVTGRPAAGPSTASDAAPMATTEPSSDGVPTAAVAADRMLWPPDVAPVPGIAAGHAEPGAAGGSPAARPTTASVPVPGRPALTAAASGPRDAQPGATLTLTYEVHNPGSEAIEVVLGGAIRRGAGDWRTDPSDERVVRVPPGWSTQTRHVRVPTDAPAGTYDVRLALQSVDRRTIYAELTDAASLVVSSDWPPGAPDVPVPPDHARPSPVPTPSPPEPPTPAATASAVPPTATPTAIPPTATPTAGPPSATPTPPVTATPLPSTSTPPPATPTPLARVPPSQAQSAPALPPPGPPSTPATPTAASAARPAPAPPAAATSRSGSGASGRDGGRGARLDCPDFSSQAAAQATLRENPSDPHHLDADRDGIACENNRPPRDSRRVPR